MPDDLANHPMIRRLLDQIQQLESRVAFAEARVADLGTPFGRLVMIKRGIDGGDPNTNGLLWKEQTVVGGEIVDFEDGRGCDDPEDDAKLLSDFFVDFAVEFEDKDATRYVSLNKLFRVALEEDGGADGTASSPATWTYTAKIQFTGRSEQDVVVGTEMSPEIPGRPNSKTAKATAGWCTIEGGVIKLAFCNEYPTTGSC